MFCHLDVAHQAFRFITGSFDQRDLAGHNTGLAVTSKLDERSRDARFRPRMAIKKPVRAGDQKKKRHRFHVYDKMVGYQR